jgi:hypothetical protein
VLRTFASTKGDTARTAKIVGISPDDVKAEITSLLRTNGDMYAGEIKAVAASAGGTGSRGSVAKAKGKKR